MRVHTVVVSTQHSGKVTLDDLRKDVLEKVIKTVIPEKYLDENTKYHINPCGEFVIGGPMADAGLTGRKIIVDTYGGWGAHGGGAFSGKDYTKVDRSAAYAASNIMQHVGSPNLWSKLDFVEGVWFKCPMPLVFPSHYLSLSWTMAHP